jgi:hypothetical protein
MAKLKGKYARCIARETKGSRSRAKARSECYYKLYRAKGRTRTR